MFSVLTGGVNILYVGSSTHEDEAEVLAPPDEAIPSMSHFTSFHTSDCSIHPSDLYTSSPSFLSASTTFCSHAPLTTSVYCIQPSFPIAYTSTAPSTFSSNLTLFTSTVSYSPPISITHITSVPTSSTTLCTYTSQSSVPSTSTNYSPTPSPLPSPLPPLTPIPCSKSKHILYINLFTSNLFFQLQLKRSYKRYSLIRERL